MNEDEEREGRDIYYPHHSHENINDDEMEYIRRGANNNGSPTTLEAGCEDENSLHYQRELSSHDRSRSNRSLKVLRNYLNCCDCRRCSSSQEKSSQCGSERRGGYGDDDSISHLQGEETNEDEVSEEVKACRVLKGLALIFSRRPLVVLLTTIIIAFSITWIGLNEYGLPEFDDPYLGFETRSTSISNRLVTLRNLKNEVNQLKVLENYPGEKLSGREWRRKRRRRDAVAEPSEGAEEYPFDFHTRDRCSNNPMEEYSRVALELKEPANIFDYETVMLICFFQKKLEDLSSYNLLCEKDGGYECCPGWSLPNYIAGYNNKTDCAQLQKANIRSFENDMKYCRNFYKREAAMQKQSDAPGDCWKRDGALCPNICWHGGFIHSAYTLTLDNHFLTKNESRYTMLILPVAKTSNDYSVMEYLQEELPDIILPKDYVFLAGYDFGGKDNLFKSYLVSDLQYMVIASILIFFVVCFYTKSFFVAVISFSVLTLSLGNAYFIYSAVLRVPYFPFMNMLVTIIVMGIGTDGTLILGSQWHRIKAKRQRPQQRQDKLYWERMMTELLAETTAPLIITTCTTAAAFFASLTSSITTIRCFSIFAGTATLMGFILLYFSVPPALILSDLVISYLKSLLPSESESKGRFYLKIMQFFQRLGELQRAFSNVFISPYQYISKTLITNHRGKCWVASFLILSSVLMWSTFVVFIHPQFQLPNTEQFQLLSSDHPIEKFDRIVEPEFTVAGISEEELGDKMTVYYVWGLKSSDTGNKFDPMDNGHLEFDEGFSMSNPQSQKWLRKLCGKLKTEPFYDEVANTMVGAHYDSCFLDTMVKWMKRDCEHIFFRNVSYAPCCKMSKFPYDSEVFDKCVGLASRDMHRTPSSYFRADVAGPKFFVMTDSLKQKDQTGENSSSTTPASVQRMGRDGELATFTLRVKTNITFSLVYERMDKFYKQLENSFNEFANTEKVPQGLENGFFVSAHLDFYDLQTSLLSDTVQSVLLSAALCFLLLWIFVRELRVAVGAVICIFAIVLVSSAILITAFNWKLGVFESIAVTVAIGLSDFTAHNSIEFAKRKSVAAMTSPTFFAATTTIIMGLMMLTCSNVLVYQQIGAFFFVLILVSWTYSVFFLSPVLATFDYILTAIRLRRVPKPPSSIFSTPPSFQPNSQGGMLSGEVGQSDAASVMEGTVYCNSMLARRGGSRRSRRNKEDKLQVKLRSKNRAISEPTIHNARNSVHFGRAESTELVESPSAFGTGSRAMSMRSTQNMMEQWKLLKKLGTETAV